MGDIGSVSIDVGGSFVWLCMVGVMGDSDSDSVMGVGVGRA